MTAFMQLLRFNVWCFVQFERASRGGNRPKNGERTRLSASSREPRHGDFSDCEAPALPKAASSRCASLTPAFCSCSRTTGVFTAT
jgi:hypothetical protein